MAGQERIPLSDYCPLQRSEVDDVTKLELRDRAVELQYGDDTSIEPSDIPGILVGEFGVAEADADMAADCLGRIYRNNCATCVIALANGCIGLRPRLQPRTHQPE